MINIIIATVVIKITINNNDGNNKEKGKTKMERNGVNASLV